ncbi:MAG: hypothetical protein AAFP10_07900 [Pseudomonadota bacterium]
MLFSELLNPVFQRTFSASYLGIEQRIELALTPVYRDPTSLRYHMVIMKRSGDTQQASDKNKLSSYFNAYDTVLNGKRELISIRYHNRLYKSDYAAELNTLESQIFICGLAEEPNDDNTTGHYLVGFILMDGLDPKKIDNPFFIHAKNYQNIIFNPDKLSNLIFDITDNYQTIYRYLHTTLPDSNISYTQFINQFKQPYRTHHGIIHGREFGKSALMTPKMFTTIRSLIQKYRLKNYLDAYYIK